MELEDWSSLEPFGGLVIRNNSPDQREIPMEIQIRMLGMGKEMDLELLHRQVMDA